FLSCCVRVLLSYFFCLSLFYVSLRFLLFSFSLSCSLLSFFFLLTLPPPTSTLFPYTTLFRSLAGRAMRRPCPGQTTCPVSRSRLDRKSTRLNSSHVSISYAVFCLKKKKNKNQNRTHKSK